MPEHQHPGVLPPAPGVRHLRPRSRGQVTVALPVIVDRPRVMLGVAHPQRLRPVRTGHLVPPGTRRPQPGPSGRPAGFASA
ncbi:hypothetical protein SLNWT_5682 [Streptomyces albus]|uniref:Uncharacterized protein n=1 Tax=Streptomyces albus (strain ATCC 21838 / DSM 41398 / FERM P-419 / JCM 4703 / NBRC 107858) TaxID=1081613 RepID=A0A0B5ET98_STRA4|nr:hypothetical protein SLNWT_5682 [Streptomyces albus]AOU80359.1 hypothetical protein SLNHY_5668 [Streptomyces albus]AYN36071.1 hypothetical protein DUI70_5576 [Streptomyces albus]